MSKLAALGLIVAFVCLPVTGAEKDKAKRKIGEGMALKGTRGVVNVMTGPVELPVQLIKGYRHGVGCFENRPASQTAGFFLGFFRGLSHWAGRGTWGMLEFFGCWTANAPDNRDMGIPFDAEYPWEEGERHQAFRPSFMAGWVRPVGRKLSLGLANGFCGLAEIPSQIAIGRRDGHVIRGTFRGVWFALSREAYGFGQTFTCLLPNPPDTLGYTFNGEYPWSGLRAGEAEEE